MPSQEVGDRSQSKESKPGTPMWNTGVLTTRLTTCTTDAHSNLCLYFTNMSISEITIADTTKSMPTDKFMNTLSKGFLRLEYIHIT